MKSSEKKAGVDEQSHSDILHKFFTRTDVDTLEKSNISTAMGRIDRKGHDGRCGYHDGSLYFRLFW